LPKKLAFQPALLSEQKILEESKRKTTNRSCAKGKASITHVYSEIISGGTAQNKAVKGTGKAGNGS